MAKSGEDVAYSGCTKIAIITSYYISRNRDNYLDKHRFKQLCRIPYGMRGLKLAQPEITGSYNKSHSILDARIDIVKQTLPAAE